MSKRIAPWFFLINALLVHVQIITGTYKQLDLASSLCDKVGAHERAKELIKAACTGQKGMIKGLLGCDHSILNATHSNGITALACAAAQGHKGVVYYLLNQGANPNIRDKAKRTALMHAARAGHTKIVSRLIRASKESIDWCDKDGVSALAMAVMGDNVPVARTLLKAKASFAQRDSRGQSLLVLAVSHKSENVVPVLLEAGLSCNDVVSLGVTPLMFAAEQDTSAIAASLLRYGADVNAKEVRGNTPLLIAAVNDSRKTCELLLKAGASINEQNKCGNTALHCAALCDHAEMIDILLAAGAEVNVTNHKGATPLIAALYVGSAASVKRLLVARADVHAQIISGETTLMVAVGGKLPHVLRDLLVNYEFDLEKKDNSGNTALLQAIAGGRVGRALELIKFGASIHACNCSGETPLLLAIRGGHELVINYLLKRKSINVNQADSIGRTPLMRAAMKGNAELCVRLLQLGADVYAKDQFENCVLKYASAGKSGEVVSRALLQRSHFSCLPNELKRFDITCEQVQGYTKQRYFHIYDFLSAVLGCNDPSVITTAVETIGQFELVD
jgi:ankyrin repeat protein